LDFVALNPTYILPVLLLNAKPNNSRLRNRTPKVYISIKLADVSGQQQRFCKIRACTTIYLNHQTPNEDFK
jgi:hypothetical protein